MSGDSAAFVVYDMNLPYATPSLFSLSSLSAATHPVPITSPVDPYAIIYPSATLIRSDSPRRCSGTLTMTCSRIRDWVCGTLHQLRLPWKNYGKKDSPPCTQDLSSEHQPYWENALGSGTQVLTNTMRELSRQERQQQLNNPTVETVPSEQGSSESDFDDWEYETSREEIYHLCPACSASYNASVMEELTTYGHATLPHIEGPCPHRDNFIYV